MDAGDLITPRLYPLSYDGARERVRFVPLGEEDYRAASFLDERVLGSTGFGEWAPLEALRGAMSLPHAECDFIFHIGHVGSTLLSRLLGEHERVFSLREPAILRTLAIADLASQDSSSLEERTRLFLALWARVWRAPQRTLLKATSFVSELGPLMMRLSPSASAILMSVRPDVHIAAILASEASRAELVVNASMRLARLHRRLGGQVWRLDGLSDGERAAMSWLSEAMALRRLATGFPDRVLWLDFDAFLADPEERLSALLRRLHGRAPQGAVQAVLRSADFGRYAKAPEHPFSSNMRREILNRAAEANADEISRGMAWLERAANAHADVGEVRGLLAP